MVWVRFLFKNRRGNVLEQDMEEQFKQLRHFASVKATNAKHDGLQLLLGIGDTAFRMPLSNELSVMHGSFVETWVYETSCEMATSWVLVCQYGSER
jgi:hypothetical protein